MVPFACAVLPAGAARLGPMPTVLVAEDDFLLSELAADLLADEGYRVLLADDADRAESLIVNETVDLLFTDIDLARGTNGLDLARRARRRMPRLPVLYTSGGRYRLHSDDAVPGSTFFPKPYRMDDVVRTIARELARA